MHRLQVRLGRRADGLLLNRSVSLEPGARSLRLREELPCPAQREEGAVLTVTMVDEHGRFFEDAIAVSFNAGFEHVLKWVALLPFALTVGAVLAASLVPKAPLPF